jgi:hypothetical protein
VSSLTRAAFEEAVRSKVPMFWAPPIASCAVWRIHIKRRATGYVGFGSGIYQCVGRLRLDGECALLALAGKAAAIEITRPPPRR